MNKNAKYRSEKERAEFFKYQCFLLHKENIALKEENTRLKKQLQEEAKTTNEPQPQ
ncbi:hypothetical protein V9L05_08745 [Bernardetia sp. Wsw4-3y2]|uniref:hypothetical protein n=1 Tax=Bernardetia sp. Wsw4-3y2 TaxID=3127471 RepID=UPI0030D56D58